MRTQLMSILVLVVLANVSFELAVVKPDAEAFQHVVEALGCAPDEILFVSSNGWDAAAAAAYGFHTAWVNRAGEPVDRSEYYFREALYFEAADGPYAWLNRILAIGVGERTPDTVLIEAFEVL